MIDYPMPINIDVIRRREYRKKKKKKKITRENEEKGDGLVRFTRGVHLSWLDACVRQALEVLE